MSRDGSSERRGNFAELGGEAGRNLRRMEVWRLKLVEGYANQDIADKLGISASLVASDIKAHRRALADANVYTAKEAMDEFLERNQAVIRMARERMDKETRLEDDHAALVSGILARAADDPMVKVSLPMAPRTSHAALIGEIRKANQDFGKVTGILRDNDIINISMQGDRNLAAMALKLGIDLASLGIPEPTTRAVQIESPSGDPPYLDGEWIESEAP